METVHELSEVAPCVVDWCSSIEKGDSLFYYVYIPRPVYPIVSRVSRVIIGERKSFLSLLHSWLTPSMLVQGFPGNLLFAYTMTGRVRQAYRTNVIVSVTGYDFPSVLRRSPLITI